MKRIDLNWNLKMTGLMKMKINFVSYYWNLNFVSYYWNCWT